MMKTRSAALLVALTLTACRGAAQEELGPAPANEIAASEPAATEANTRDSAAQPAPDPAVAEKPAETTFPAALQGRWGLVPGDCTSTRGDAKGLVTITAGEVRFYESVARPAKIVEHTSRVIRGEFDFTGEGMEWTNYMTWSVTGDRLTRVDSEEDSRLVYTRC